MSQPLADPALDQLFRTARSYNGYQDKPVSTEQLHAIWDLMKFGTTSANAEKIRSAPVTAIIGMDMEFYEKLPELFPHADARSWFVDSPPMIEATAFRNSSLQGAYFILAARALGLDTGPMSGFNPDAVNAAFFADTPNIKVNFISTLGYGDPATIFGRSPRPDFDVFNSIA